jgi:hypothetical protein
VTDVQLLSFKYLSNLLLSSHCKSGDFEKLSSSVVISDSLIEAVTCLLEVRFLKSKACVILGINTGYEEKG